MPLYIDFYLLLDNSPSMGVGATPADVAKMVNNTPDACAFACHDTSPDPGHLAGNERAVSKSGRRRAHQQLNTEPTVVMPGHSGLLCADCVNLSALPGIHVLLSFCKGKDVDGRDKPGHDEYLSPNSESDPGSVRATLCRRPRPA
jgi:hypothetical protein